MDVSKKPLKISLKKAGFSDTEFLWHLRNRPDVYKYSRQKRKVSWQEHINWIIPIILGMAPKDLFLIRHSGRRAGQIRFDYQENKTVEVSISVLKEFRGRGIALKALGLAIRKIKKQKIIAEIHKNNLPSMKLFAHLGFKLKTKKGNWLKYCYG